jgi:hypothetical protein
VNGNLDQGSSRNGKNGLYTLKNDLVEPIVDKTRKNIHFYDPVLLA